MATPKPLRLMAEDSNDLKVISAALQDAVSKVGGFRYQAKRRRFSLELNRFRWEDVVHDGGKPARARAILGVDGVTGVRARGLTKSDPELVISFLSAEFVTDDEPPGGKLKLLFAGDGEIEIDVECLDVTLLDSDTIWNTRHTPDHESRSGRR
ncbi:MAG: DUF2948 family protein [Pseudomonadota bacterium]